LCVALGGRAAEDIFFQKISTGASDDLRKVTNMAQSMVVEWGMSPKLPNMVFPESDSFSSVKPMSDRTSEIIDEEVLRIVSTQYGRVKELLESKKDLLEVLSETLLKEETINHDTIVKVLGPRPFQNDEYLEFIKQNQKELTPQEKVILGIKDDKKGDKKNDTESTTPPTPPTPPTELSTDVKIADATPPTEAKVEVKVETVEPKAEVKVEAEPKTEVKVETEPKAENKPENKNDEKKD